MIRFIIWPQKIGRRERVEFVGLCESELLDFSKGMQISCKNFLN